MSDLILTNARIHTLNATQPTARSIAIRDNQILALGTADAMRSLLPNAAVIDLHDRCVIPDLSDAHLHAEWTAFGLKNVDAEAPTLVDQLTPEWVELTTEQRERRSADHTLVNCIIGETVDVQDHVIDRHLPWFDFVDKILGPIDEWLDLAPHQPLARRYVEERSTLSGSAPTYFQKLST
ncbi:N-substituted formamide deformylase [Thermoflexales bacterium]|nr:N-substituted formamide deformylase [Thermoflexales bacterium]